MRQIIFPVALVLTAVWVDAKEYGHYDISAAALLGEFLRAAAQQREREQRRGQHQK